MRSAKADWRYSRLTQSPPADASIDAVRARMRASCSRESARWACSEVRSSAGSVGKGQPPGSEEGGERAGRRYAVGVTVSLGFARDPVHQPLHHVDASAGRRRTRVRRRVRAPATRDRERSASRAPGTSRCGAAGRSSGRSPRAGLSRPVPPAPSYAATSAVVRAASDRANSKSTMASSRVGSPGPALSKSITQADPSGVPRRLSAHRSRCSHWWPVIGVSSSSAASRCGTSAARSSANGAPAPRAALTSARHSAGADRVGAPPVRRCRRGDDDRVQPRDRVTHQGRVEQVVRVVDVGPRLHPDGLALDDGDVPPVDVRERSRAGHPGLVAARLERGRGLGLGHVDVAERLLQRERAARGDQAAYLALLTPCRFDLQPGVGAEVEAVRNLGGQLAVHGPMVTERPARAGEVGGSPRRRVDRGGIRLAR